MPDGRIIDAYRVTGQDEEGDLHSFESLSRERAEAMEAQFREDLSGVKLVTFQVYIEREPPELRVVV
jgi:hypothetical protein